MNTERVSLPAVIETGTQAAQLARSTSVPMPGIPEYLLPPLLSSGLPVVTRALPASGGQPGAVP